MRSREAERPSGKRRGGGSRPVFVSGRGVSRQVTVRNATRGVVIVGRAEWCASFLCKLRGLSLRRTLPEDTGILLVESTESRWASAIHMFGMRFDLGIVWVSGDGRVVDARHARRWRIYIPRRAARFTLEASPSVLGRVQVGEILEFVTNEAPA